MKLSIIIPVYFNADTLELLYNDIKEKVICNIDYDYEIMMVDDGSQDDSYEVILRLAEQDSNIKAIKLSRNFGSHSAMLCGLANCTGDCAVIKCADLQEPSEMILDMIESWKKGNNVVLAVREDREESFSQKMFANMYYWGVRKCALPNMPKGGFDVYLIDRKVINVLTAFDEKNSALTGQVLWSGFKTEKIYYVRKARTIGKSRWTLKKKIRLVLDTLFSFSTLPIAIIWFVGIGSSIGAVIWAGIVLILRLCGEIVVSGWTTLFIFNLLSFGVTMLTLGILGEYLWRTFDASRRRPPYIIEKENLEKEKL